MSMELHVAFSGTMPTGAAMDAALAALGLPFRLAEPPDSLEGWIGRLPFVHEGQPTGIELDTFDGADAVGDAIGVDAPEGADRVASLRWGGDLLEAATAFAAAAALGSVLGGTIFEPSEGAFLSIEEAVAYSQDALEG